MLPSRSLRAHTNIIYKTHAYKTAEIHIHNPVTADGTGISAVHDIEDKLNTADAGRDRCQ